MMQQLLRILGIILSTFIGVHFGYVNGITRGSYLDSLGDKLRNQSEPNSLLDLIFPDFNLTFSMESDGIIKGSLLGGRCTEDWECQIWDENAHCYTASYLEEVPRCHCKMGYKRKKYQCQEVDPSSHQSYFMARDDLRTMVLVIAITVGLAAVGALILFAIRKCQNNASSAEFQDFRRISVNSQFHLPSHDHVVINSLDQVQDLNNSDKPPAYDIIQRTESSPPSYEIAIISEDYSHPQNLEKVPMNTLRC